MHPTPAPARDELQAELDRQIEVLLEKGYPKLAGLSPADFVARLEPLRQRLGELPAPREGRFPFVLVVRRELAPEAAAIERVSRRGKAGFSVLPPDDLARFRPIEALRLPEGPAYLLADIDTGKESLNITPDAALEIFNRQGRSPLTIEEGIALLTQQPEAVAKNGGFSLLGSRCGDRRVCALWISEGRPKLGWCWAGNPHTWLGSASCAQRLGSQGGRPVV